MQIITDKIQRTLKYMFAHGTLLKHHIEYANDIKDKTLSEYELPHEITDILLNNIHFVDSFKSDVLIDIKTITRDLLNNDSAIHVIAMRRSGVDGNEFFMSRIEDFWRSNNCTGLCEYYRKVFVVYTHKITAADINNPNNQLGCHNLELSRYHINDYLIAIVDATNSIPLPSAIE